MKKRKDFTTGRKKPGIVAKKSVINNSASDVKYQCPMKCHGEEVFDEPGLCPDSKMQMIPVNGGYIFY